MANDSVTIKENSLKNLWSSQKSVIFLFITILLDAIGLGILIPIFPDLLKRFTSDAASVSEYFGYFIGIYSFMQFWASPILGALSDRYGRKPVLLVSLIGTGLDYIFMAFAPSVLLLLVGRLISGATGASMAVASSYMADISDEKSRTSNFGLINAAWGIGFIAGPALGGLLGFMGPKAPFFVASILNILNFIYGVFVLPESLPAAQRRQFQLKSLNPLKSILKILKPSPFLMLIWIYFLIMTAGMIHPVNWTIYTETKFGWSAWEVGLSLSFIGLVIAITQVALIQRLIDKFGEHKAITFGIIIYAVCFALFGLATKSWMMYAIMLFFGLSGITVPALQSIMAQHIPANEQGEFQGSLISLGSVSSILAPLIFTTLFVKFTEAHSTYFFPGISYIAAAIICLFALIIWKI